MDVILPLQVFLLATLVHTVGAGLQGSVGYGMALLSGPVLIMLDPRLMPGPYLLSSLVLSILMVIRERRALVLGTLVWAILGRIPGATLAAWLLLVLPEKTISLAFAVMILLGVVLSLVGLRFTPNRVNLFIAGVFSGIMGTIAAIGGPPIALVYQRESGDRLRTNMSLFFVFGTLISIISLIPAGKMGGEQLVLSLYLMPSILLGFFASNWLVKRLKNAWLRPLVLGVAAVSAVVVLVRQIF